MDGLLFLPIILPALAGIILLILSFRENIRRGLHLYVGIVLTLSAALALFAAWTGEKTVTLFSLVDGIPVYFHVDATGRFFVTLVSVVWLAAGFFSFRYMEHEGGEKRFFGFFLMLYGVLTGLSFSGNLVTLYLFYELMTLVSMPLVLHSGTREAVMAALKYLFYSMCGAYAGLFGIFFLYRYCGSLSFVAGGTLNAASAQGHEGILRIAVFVMLVGFGAKAGMLPLHVWLPTAHPAAPSPASAALSGIIVKAGVLAALRTVYYVVGADFIRGTWVQYAWMTLTLLTVLMGSVLAFREKGIKKRLAYSTVSQLSYILFGLSLLHPTAVTGALLHAASHAVIKCGLFLTAGVFVYQFGYTRVEELTGVGKKMPKTMWCYLIFSLGLIGIPPTSGFVSKWYLAAGSLQSGAGVFSWLGPAVLLVSALLTAGYLLPIAMKGFFPGKEEESSGEGLKDSLGNSSEEGPEESPGNSSGAGPGNSPEEDPEEMPKRESSPCMLLPLVGLAVLVLLLGILPNPLVRYLDDIAASVLWQGGLG